MVCSPGDAGEVRDLCGAGRRAARAADRRLLGARLRSDLRAGRGRARRGRQVRVQRLGRPLAPARRRRAAAGPDRRAPRDAPVPAPFVLEGGAIFVDGEGTLITTEQCLLDPNRNPDLTRAQIEQGLRDYLGRQDDRLAPDRARPGYRAGGHGRPCRRRRAVPGARPRAAGGPERSDGRRIRRRAGEPGQRCAARSMPAGGHRRGRAWIRAPTRASRTPTTTSPTVRSSSRPVATPATSAMLAFLATVYPGREIVGVPGDTLAFGGGGPHCITQQIPVGASRRLTTGGPMSIGVVRPLPAAVRSVAGPAARAAVAASRRRGGVGEARRLQLGHRVRRQQDPQARVPRRRRARDRLRHARLDRWRPVQPHPPGRGGRGPRRAAAASSSRRAGWTGRTPSTTGSATSSSAGWSARTCGWSRPGFGIGFKESWEQALARGRGTAAGGRTPSRRAPRITRWAGSGTRTGPTRWRSRSASSASSSTRSSSVP